MKTISFFVLAGAAIAVLAGCPSGTYSVGDILEITVDNSVAELNDDGDLEFGMVEAEEGSETVSVTVTNIGTAEISITAIEISDTANYSLELPSLPGVLAEGETTMYSLTFSPTGSGDFPAAVSITAEDFTEPAEMGVLGEGNYAPVPLFGIEITGAGTAGANGFYERDGFKSTMYTTRPLYTMEGSTDYHIYLYDPEGEMWCIDDGLDAGVSGDPLYDAPDGYDSIVPTDDPLEWYEVEGASPSPSSITVYDIKGTDPWTGETLTAYYLYSDAEGDPEVEGSAQYQWYRSENEEGPFTTISGENGMTYTTQEPEDDGMFLAVGITLTASTGITEGGEVLSSGTAEFFTE